MLSYRHAFHAGNHADVLKHAVLVLLLTALKRKDKAFVYIDTHAGAGRYDLADRPALQTQEFKDGIAHWWRTPAPPLAAYLECVRAENPDGELRWYPGSPVIARGLLRPEDRMVLLEMHTTDHAILAQEFADDPAVRVERGDAHERLKAWLPPSERRGLVLIDPPYEIRKEDVLIIDLLVDAHRRWATGIYAVWFPILSRLSAQRFIERLAATGIRRQLLVEYLPFGEDAAAGLKGSGMVIVNPPFQLEEDLQALCQLFETSPGARSRLRWMVGE